MASEPYLGQASIQGCHVILKIIAPTSRFWYKVEHGGGMARVVRRTWVSDVESGLPRRARSSCAYDAYVPDLLAERDFRFAADVVADLSDAERAIQRLNESARALKSTETLARLLLRAESVASSRIEGLEVGGR